MFISDLKDANLLPKDSPQRPFGTPTPIILAAYIVPYLICSLVHIPNTRILRLGLLPLGLLSTVYLVATFRSGNGIFSLLILHHALIYNFNSGVRWALATEPPVYKPVSPPPRLQYLRGKTPFQGLNLSFDCYRHITLVTPPSSPTSNSDANKTQRQTVPYNLTLIGHALGLFKYLLMIDLVSFPTNILISPNNPTFGLEAPLGRLIWGISYFLKASAGEIAASHLFALLGIGSGLWGTGEWGVILDRPWAATSVNDFWGRRWHNLMTETFIRYIPFFHSQPKPLQILSIFTASALYHSLLYYPMHHQFPVYQQSCFYVGSALVCLLERAYGKVSGKRVEGTWGMIWTWIMILIVAGPLVEYCHQLGWGADGRVLAREKVDSSPFFLLYKAFGGSMVKE